MEAGKNVEVTVKGNTLTIVVDLAEDQGISKSGKSQIIATTSGNAAIGGGVIIGLNVYRKV